MVACMGGFLEKEISKLNICNTLNLYKEYRQNFILGNSDLKFRLEQINFNVSLPYSCFSCILRLSMPTNNIVLVAWGYISDQTWKVDTELILCDDD